MTHREGKSVDTPGGWGHMEKTRHMSFLPRGRKGSLVLRWTSLLGGLGLTWVSQPRSAILGGSSRAALCRGVPAPGPREGVWTRGAPTHLPSQTNSDLQNPRLKKAELQSLEGPGLCFCVSEVPWTHRESVSPATCMLQLKIFPRWTPLLWVIEFHIVLPTPKQTDRPAWNLFFFVDV